MTRRGDLFVELCLDLVGQAQRVGDEHRGSHRVVLGLADQVCGDVRRVGGVVGQDRDLGGSGLGVDPDDALEQSLRSDGVDVARSGDEVHPTAGPRAVGEHRDRLGAADGVHLRDAEQLTGSQDRRVRESRTPLAEAGRLRRAGEGDRADAGHLGGYDVHQHARDQRRQTSGDVEAHPVDRDHPCCDSCTRSEVGDRVGLHLGRAGDPEPSDGLFEPRPNARIQSRQRLAQCLAGHHDVSLVHAVEALAVLQDRLDPPVADVVADRPYDVQRGLDIEVGARHESAVVGRCASPVSCPGGALGRDRAASQVDPANHGPSLGARDPATGPAPGGRTPARTRSRFRDRRRRLAM